MSSPTITSLFQSLSTSQRTTIGNGRFPVELLQHIFSDLHWLDLICCRLTCRLWSQSVPLSSHFIKDPEAPPRIPYVVSGDATTMTSDCSGDGAQPPKLVISVAATRTSDWESDEEQEYNIKINKCSEARLSKWASRRLNPFLLDPQAELERLSAQTPTSHSHVAVYAPWHAMYICLPPMSQLHITTTLDNNAEESNDISPDGLALCSHCNKNHDHWRWRPLEKVYGCKIGSTTVSRQEGILVGDIMGVLSELLEGAQDLAFVQEMYTWERR